MFIIQINELILCSYISAQVQECVHYFGKDVFFHPCVFHLCASTVKSHLVAFFFWVVVVFGVLVDALLHIFDHLVDFGCAQGSK